MNIYDEYVEQKKRLDELWSCMRKTLKKYDIGSVEIFSVLKVLAQYDNITQADVAGAADLNINTVSSIVLKLAARGLITNEPDKRDFSKRILKRKLLNITPKGLEIIKACMADLNIVENETDKTEQHETTV